MKITRPAAFGFIAALVALSHGAADTDKPPLHGRRWMAITGKPLGATAGARMFEKGGNAADAACAMLGVVCTMYDDVSWGGEAQILVYNPQTKKVVGINGLGMAPSGATAEFFKEKKMKYPPSEGPLAAVTPGNPGALMTLLAEFGTLSLKTVLEPSMQMAEGYPIEAELCRKIQNNAAKLGKWPYSRQTFLVYGHDKESGPKAGELFRQPDLLQTLRKLVAAEEEALRAGKSRREAIYAAFDRFYKGDIAAEFCRGSQEQGGLHTVEDLANWKAKLEAPVSTTYKDITVYKLTHWTQGPVMLQALNLLEPMDLVAMGYNSGRYIHTLYQVMNLAYADRDFYYGDPDFPPVEPIAGLLSKKYADARRSSIDPDKNNPKISPGDPYPFEDKENPFLELLKDWNTKTNKVRGSDRDQAQADADFLAGTTSIQAADISGWAISITPSGGWMPACLAGRTGIGLSQRMQSFVLDPSENPFNIVEPGKRPRVTLTPTLALKNDRPHLCFSVQGGDTQDQNLLQFFLNFVEFGMTVQEACEAANITSYQMRSSFGAHEFQPGRITVNSEVPSWVRRDLQKRGYTVEAKPKTSGPITAVYFDWEHGSLWGGASDDGEDYGIAW